MWTRWPNSKDEDSPTSMDKQEGLKCRTMTLAKVPELTLAVSQRARVGEEVRHHARRTTGKVDPNSHKPSSRLSKTPYYRRWRSRFEREGQAFLSFRSARSLLPLGQSSPSPNNKEAKSPELRTAKQLGIGMYEIHLSCGFVVVFS